LNLIRVMPAKGQDSFSHAKSNARTAFRRNAHRTAIARAIAAAHCARGRFL